MLQRWKSATNLFLARLLYNLADEVDSILENTSNSDARDKELRKLLNKHAPCPVAGSCWSLVNSIDYDFTGFKSKDLSDHAATHDVLHVAHLQHTPSLTVLRDLALAAKLAYEDPKVVDYVCQSWNMTTTSELFFSSGSTQGFIMYDQQNTVLSFRGTELINTQDWGIDFKVNLVPMNAHAADGANPDEASKKPMAHEGFLEALGLTYSEEIGSLYAQICAVLNLMRTSEPSRKLWITGHSLGASLASLFVAQLLLDDDQLLDSFGGLYTYGQPRTGDAEYCNLFSDLIERGLVYRTVHENDTFTKVPLKMMNYVHHGCKLHIERSTLMIKIQEEKVEVKRTNKTVLPPDSGLKKLVVALLPDSLEAHYPSEYVRNIQLFI